MRETIQAEFENLDSAEAAAHAIKKQIHDAKITAVYPEHPESIRLTRPHSRRFTLLPTAVLSQNYITALIETEYGFEDLNEIQKRQTSMVQLVCDSESVPAAHRTLTGHGGTIRLPS